MNPKNLIPAFALLLVLSGIGCGGSSNSVAMTQAQASAAFTDVFLAMEEAGGSAFLGQSTPVSLLHKQEAKGIQNAILNGALVPVSTDSIARAAKESPDTTTTIPTFTYPCPGGGTIVVTGSYSVTATTMSASTVETITNCKDSGVTMNGDPDIAISMSDTTTGTTTTATVAMSGGLTVGSSSCTTDLNVNLTLNDKTDHGTETYSGKFCNVALSGSESF